LNRGWELPELFPSCRRPHAREDGNGRRTSRRCADPTFPSDKQLCSWVAVCPGDNESGGVNYSHRSPKGNRQIRRILNQAANAAARTKGSIFEIVYRRQVTRMGHNQALGVIAHRLCQLIWILLHRKVRYEERGPAVTERSKRKRTARMVRELLSLGYHVDPPTLQQNTSA
jgi:hypothetical protein